MRRLWQSIYRTLAASGIAASLLLIVSCRPTTSSEQTGSELLIAAASNLTDVSEVLGKRFTDRTGVRVVFSFGATADLARQIENGAPFDVFVAADVTNVDRLEQQGLLSTDNRSIYALGRLVIWVPPGKDLRVQRIQDITAKEFDRIAIAKPDIAPYGQAAVESLRALDVWDHIQHKLIYAQNVAQAKQFAATGNAEVALIPLALVKTGEGAYLEVDQNLHRPIEQALAIVKSSSDQTAARQFVDFLLSEEGQQILAAGGYRRAR